MNKTSAAPFSGEESASTAIEEGVLRKIKEIGLDRLDVKHSKHESNVTLGAYYSETCTRIVISEKRTYWGKTSTSVEVNGAIILEGQSASRVFARAVEMHKEYKEAEEKRRFNEAIETLNTPIKKVDKPEGRPPAPQPIPLEDRKGW